MALFRILTATLDGSGNGTFISGSVGNNLDWDNTDMDGIASISLEPGGSVFFHGADSGQTILQAQNLVSPTITLPATTGTLALTGAIPPFPLSGANGGTGVANTSKTITIGANLTTTGTSATVLAFPSSGTPTYTYPAATQTIASLAGIEVFTNKTLTSPVIANIAPGANFTLTQNGVAAMTSVNSGAIVNTLYLSAGRVGIGTTSPQASLDTGTGRITGGVASGAARNYLDLSTGFGITSMDFTLNNGCILRPVSVDFFGTGDFIFQCNNPTTAGYSYFQAFNGAGLMLGTGNSTNIGFTPNNVEKARLYVSGGLSVGSANIATDPGAGNLLATGLVGTATNNSASAGNVGEIISSLIATGSAVSLTTATGANVTTISLTAGDWDVEGNVNFNLTGATATAFSAGISLTTATVPTDGSEVASGVVTTAITGVNGITLPRKRVSIAGTTTVYLVAKSTFTLGTETAFGAITARRVR